MVVLQLADRLEVAYEPGGDEWDVQVEIRHDDELVTALGTNTRPWEPPGKVMLRNVIAKRLDAHYDRDEVEAMIEEAIAAHERELKERLGSS